ncbi:hypothetical protein [Micromonospora sp. WMMD812]|uniref:hypothetical protein n=1 Tax=Micromonospora sp. WMMD812 TaxID=3015152 RepID=UPI00248CD89E|nr:hypothetical protein [Micromonospora sp. WMMD812]WBB70033.1 hypothetical protein O7603_12000 [Micromonospora sp. WMMD812]
MSATKKLLVRGSPGPQPGRWWLVSALLAAVVAGLLLVLLPVSTTVESRARPSSPAATPTAAPVAPEERRRESLLARDGWRVAAVAAVPVALCAAPLLAPRRGRRAVAAGTTGLLAVGVLVGAASVGLFFLPSLLLMGVAAARLRA